jgi:hypothetical protein
VTTGEHGQHVAALLEPFAAPGGARDRGSRRAPQGVDQRVADHMDAFRRSGQAAHVLGTLQQDEVGEPVDDPARAAADPHHREAAARGREGRRKSGIVAAVHDHRGDRVRLERQLERRTQLSESPGARGSGRLDAHDRKR